MTHEEDVRQGPTLSASATVYCMCLGIKALPNVEIAREEGVWGAKEKEALAEIAEGDLMVFVVGLTSRGGPNARGFPRLDSEKFPQAVDKAKEIFLVRVKSGIYNDDSPVWSDDVYPWRFRFEELGSAREVSVRDVFSLEQIEVLRLCAIQGGTARPLPGRLEGLVGVLNSSIDISNTSSSSESPNSTPVQPQDWSFQDRMEDLSTYVETQGFVFQPWQVATYVTALRTKPFVILAGVSGIGKSQLPQLVAEACGGKAELVPVRPNWTDSSDVLGYEDLQGRFRPGPLLRLAKAAQENPRTHYVCIVDEMNLARVEYYFAEVLSRMEDRKQWERGGYGSGPLLSLDLRDENSDWSGQRLPPNLAIVGTVNMDETTHSFSRKVLDRAFTLELSDIDLTVWKRSSPDDALGRSSWPIETWYPRAIRLSDLEHLSNEETEIVEKVIEALSEINTLLAQAQLQVGYRTRDETALFVLHARELSSLFVTRENEPIDPLDLVLHMKILPRIVGGTNAIRRLLYQLLGWARGGVPLENEEQANSVVHKWKSQGRPPMLPEAEYPQTAARLCLMWERLRSEGFTSFWL